MGLLVWLPVAFLVGLLAGYVIAAFAPPPL